MGYQCSGKSHILPRIGCRKNVVARTLKNCTQTSCWPEWKSTKFAFLSVGKTTCFYEIIQFILITYTYYLVLWKHCIDYNFKIFAFIFHDTSLFLKLNSENNIGIKSSLFKFIIDLNISQPNFATNFSMNYTIVAPERLFLMAQFLLDLGKMKICWIMMNFKMKQCNITAQESI